MQKLTKQAITLTLAILMLTTLAIPAMATRHPFTDVPDGRWYSDAVQFVYERNIMGGVGNNQFDPQGHLTRAQVAALLFRVHNERPANAQDDRDNNFADVNNEWFAPYITWAFNNGIVTGTSPATFHPHGNITRQEFATMVYRYAMEMTRFRDVYMASAQWVELTDRGQIAPWARCALRWMNFGGIVTGSTEITINPTGTATRAEAAVMMMRFVERLTNPLICPGCGDGRFYWMPEEDDIVEDNAVTLVLTRCVSRADNRDWILDDFSNISGVLYVRNISGLSDREYYYARRVWDAEREAHILDTPEAWQDFEVAAQEIRENTLFNWSVFGHRMFIRLDQNCEENVRRVIYQLHQQYEFIRSVGPNLMDESA